MMVTTTTAARQMAKELHSAKVYGDLLPKGKAEKVQALKTAATCIALWATA